VLSFLNKKRKKGGKKKKPKEEGRLRRIQLYPPLRKREEKGFEEGERPLSLLLSPY